MSLNAIKSCPHCMLLYEQDEPLSSNPDPRCGRCGGSLAGGPLGPQLDPADNSVAYGYAVGKFESYWDKRKAEYLKGKPIQWDQEQE